MHVRLTDDARSDLLSIKEYIAKDNPRAAQRVIDAILTSAYQLELFPLLGREGRVEGTRELNLPRIPYFIVYSIPDAYYVDIDRVLHTARRYPPQR